MISTAAVSPRVGFPLAPHFLGASKKLISDLGTSSFLNIAKIMKIFPSRPPFLTQNLSSKPEGWPQPCPCQTWEPLVSLIFGLDAMVGGSVCAGARVPRRARLSAPVSCSNKACAREMSLAGLLMREPNEYEWSLHKCSFVSLNSFTPH